MHQYYNIKDVKWSENYKVIFLNIINNHDLISMIDKIKKECEAIIYVIGLRYDEKIIKVIFKLGIRDYLIHPINSEHLINKIFIDVEYYQKNNANYFKFDKLLVDYDTMDAYIGDEIIHLTKIEFKLLALFIKNIDCTLSKEYIVTKIWGYSTNDFRNLETHIKTLRKKLKDYKRNLITIYSHGYSFNSTQFNQVDE